MEKSQAFSTGETGVAKIARSRVKVKGNLVVCSRSFRDFPRDYFSQCLR